MLPNPLPGICCTAIARIAAGSFMHHSRSRAVGVGESSAAMGLAAWPRCRGWSLVHHARSIGGTVSQPRQRRGLCLLFGLLWGLG